MSSEVVVLVVVLLSVKGHPGYSPQVHSLGMVISRKGNGLGVLPCACVGKVLQCLFLWHTA